MQIKVVIVRIHLGFGKHNEALFARKAKTLRSKT